VYIRLPFYAGLFRPVASIDYPLAYALFEMFTLLSFAVAVALWGRFGPGLCLVTAAWSTPLFTMLMHGQDSALILLVASVSARLVGIGRTLAAGAVLALAAIKWHFLLPFALLVCAWNFVRFAFGFAAACVGLLAWSFWLCPAWPLEYYRALRASETTLHLSQMPNLRSLVAGLPAYLFLWTAAGVILAALCWKALRARMDPDSGVGICLLGGLLFSPHAYAYDCVLALPAIVMALSPYGSRPVLQLLAACILSACPVLLWLPGWRFIPQLLFPALLIWLCARLGKARYCGSPTVSPARSCLTQTPPLPGPQL
jgi:hypothetical protein